MSQLIHWIKSKIGCGYVYGATGWICTEKRLEQQAEQYPEYVDVSVCHKWIGRECFDCAQLVRQALQTIGVSIPSGATSQWQADVWRDRGEIGSMPDTLCALYRQDGSRMQHTGWHLGGGVTVDARSSAKGVIQSTVDAYGWTHWAIPKGLPEDDKEQESVNVLYHAVVMTQEDPLRVRAWPMTGDILGKVPRGRVVEVLEDQDDGWPRIRYNELVGYASAEYLLKAKSTPVEDIEGVEDEAELPPGVAETEHGFITRLISDDGTRIALCGVWYPDVGD